MLLELVQLVLVQQLLLTLELQLATPLGLELVLVLERLLNLVAPLLTAPWPWKTKPAWRCRQRTLCASAAAGMSGQSQWPTLPQTPVQPAKRRHARCPAPQQP